MEIIFRFAPNINLLIFVLGMMVLTLLVGVILTYAGRMIKYAIKRTRRKLMRRGANV